MRCLACDVALSDFESTRKTVSGHYLDLCNKCFYSGVHQQVYVKEREDLRGTVDVDDDQEINDE